MQPSSSLSSPPPPSSPASPLSLFPLPSAPPSLLSASALPLCPAGSPLPAVPSFLQPPVSPSSVLSSLQQAADDDAAVRLAGTARLAEWSALSGYGSCLLLVALSAGGVADSVRLLAGIELKNVVGSLFASATRNAASQASVHTTDDSSTQQHSSTTGERT